MSDLNGPRPNLRALVLAARTARHAPRAEEQLRPDVADRRTHRVVGGDLRLRHVAARDRRVRDAAGSRRLARDGAAVVRRRRRCRRTTDRTPGARRARCGRDTRGSCEATRGPCSRGRAGGDSRARNRRAICSGLPWAAAVRGLPFAWSSLTPAPPPCCRDRISGRFRRSSSSNVCDSASSAGATRGAMTADVDVRQHPIVARSASVRRTRRRAPTRRRQPRGSNTAAAGPLQTPRWAGVLAETRKKDAASSRGFPQQTAQVATVCG